MLERLVSQEANVRLVRAKIELGEADAAIVYRSDADEAVRVVEVPRNLNVKASYPIARTSSTGEPDA